MRPLLEVVQNSGKLIREFRNHVLMLVETQQNLESLATACIRTHENRSRRTEP